jgi:hypothetical protein
MLALSSDQFDQLYRALNTRGADAAIADLIEHQFRWKLISDVETRYDMEIAKL